MSSFFRRSRRRESRTPVARLGKQLRLERLEDRRLLAAEALLDAPVEAPAANGVTRYAILGDGSQAEAALAEIGVKKIKNFRHFSGLAVHLSDAQAALLSGNLGSDFRLIKDEPVNVLEQHEVPHGSANDIKILAGGPGGSGNPGGGQQVSWGISAINADDAHATTKGSGVVVCITDSGIDTDHHDIAANVLAGANYIDGGSYEDENGHGTAMAGNIAALDNTTGVLGVAPEAKLLIAKFVNRRGRGTRTDAADAIYGCMDMKAQHAPNMPMVINMSWDFSWTEDIDSILHPPILQAYNAGHIVVAAAGNGLSTDGVLRRPAIYQEVYTISGINEDLTFWESSSYGGACGTTTPYPCPVKSPEFAAPASDVISLWKGGGTKTSDGTSHSAAFFSGVMALGLSVNSLGPVGVDIGLLPEQSVNGLIDAHFTVLNTSPNASPLAVDDAYGTDEDSVLNILAPGVLANDSDPDSDPLSVSAYDSTSANGAAVVVNSDGSFTYDPSSASGLQALSAGVTLDDTFSYTASDGNGGTDSATVTVTVTGINDAPAAVDDTDSTTENVPVTTTVVANDVLGDEPTAITSVTDGANGAVSFDSAAGTTTYTPDASFVGTDHYTYTITDNDGETSTAAVTVTVSAAPTTSTYIQDEEPDLAIPDRGVATSTFVVTDSFTISNLTVTVDITHPRSSDLTVYLIHGGTTVELPSISSGNPLAFNGDDVSGFWTLEVHDGKKRQTGTLNQWQITVGAAPAAARATSLVASTALPAATASSDEDVAAQEKSADSGTPVISNVDNTVHQTAVDVVMSESSSDTVDGNRRLVSSLEAAIEELFSQL